MEKYSIRIEFKTVTPPMEFEEKTYPDVNSKLCDLMGSAVKKITVRDNEQDRIIYTCHN